MNSEDQAETPRPAPRPGAFLGGLGVKSDGEGKIIVEVGPGHLRSLGMAHGGVIATLLDSVMGWDASRKSPPNHYLVTAQLNVNFIRPAWEGETLIASSTIRHQGMQTAVTQGEIHTKEGHLVATASATFLYLAHNPKTRGWVDRQQPEAGAS